LEEAKDVVPMHLNALKIAQLEEENISLK